MLAAIKDPAAAIKLFGKTIPVLSSGEFIGPPVSEEDVGGVNNCRGSTPSRRSLDREEEEEEQEADKDANNEGDTSMEADDHPASPGGGTTPTATGVTNDSHEGTGQPLKKPDKLLPCPRCNSMDTKFCYYNNYNVNQPRHFCKSCQRYWTAGGAMRNVPVGSGRRKNKSTCASRHCQITVPAGALQAAHVDSRPHVGVYHHPAALNTDVANLVLAFGTDSPMCKSMASVLNLSENMVFSPANNGFRQVLEQNVNVPVPVRVPCRGTGEKNGDDPSGGSTASSTICSMDEAAMKPTHDTTSTNGGFATSTTPIPCFPAIINCPPNYPWNIAAVPLPPYFPSTIPIPLYPPSYCPNASDPWTLPVVPPPTLGKHPREEGNTHRSPGDHHHIDSNRVPPPVLVPKTLRIDDPDEAAKSSIWTALRIDKEKIEGSFISRGARSKGEEKALKSGGSCQALKANPAALCRSISFRENMQH